MSHNFIEVEDIVILQVDNLMYEHENNKILEEAKTYIDDELYRFIIDLSDIKFMSSMGLRFLLAMLTKSRNAGGETVLINVPEQVNKLLVMTKLQTMFSIYDTAEAAMSSFSTQSNA